MLIAISGPAAGPQPDFAADLIGSLGPAAILQFDIYKWAGRVLYRPSFDAVASLAQRLANPAKKANELQIPDLECLRTNKPFLKNVDPRALPKEMIELVGNLPEVFVIDSISRLAEFAATQVLTAAVAAWGASAEKAAFPTMQQLVSDAMSRLCYDLAQARQITIVTIWEVDTMRAGKVSGSAPSLPKSALNQINLWLRAKDHSTLVVERSTQLDLNAGMEITPIKEGWGWLAEVRRAA